MSALPESVPGPNTSLVGRGEVNRHYFPSLYSAESWAVGIGRLRLVAGLSTLASFMFLLPRLAYEDHKDHDSYSAMVAAAMSFEVDGIPLLPTLFQTVASMVTLNFLGVVAHNRLLPADKKVAAQAAGADIAVQGFKTSGIWYTIAASMNPALLPPLGLLTGFALLNAMFFTSMLPEVGLEAVRLYREPSLVKAAAFALTLGLLATGSAFLCAQQNYAFGFAAGSCVAGLFLLVCKQACCAAKEASAAAAASGDNRDDRSVSSLNTAAAGAATGLGAQKLQIGVNSGADVEGGSNDEDKKLPDGFTSGSDTDGDDADGSSQRSYSSAPNLLPASRVGMGQPKSPVTGGRHGRSAFVVQGHHHARAHVEQDGKGVSSRASAPEVSN